MQRHTVLSTLACAKPVLVARYGVTRLGLFGSTARDTARDDSDVDVLVAFDGPASAARFFGVQFHLEDQLGCSVDLVSERALRAELRPFIERDLIDV